MLEKKRRTYSARCNHVTWLKRLAFGKGSDQNGNRENEIVGAAVLSLLPVDEGLNAKRAWQMTCWYSDRSLDNGSQSTAETKYKDSPD